MKCSIVILALGIIIGSPIVNASSAAPKLAKGEAFVVCEFPANSTEGIAIDRRGNMFISSRTFDLVTGAYVKNEILKINPDGDSVVVADLGSASPGSFGILGLATGFRGEVYAAFASFNSNHGVWKIKRDGTKYRLPGSEQIALPNSLVFDWRGNLYVTDSDPVDLSGVGIWKASRRGQLVRPWSSHELVLSDPSNPFGAPIVAANGIAFYPPDNIYVANSERSLIARVPITRRGKAGEATVVASNPPAPNLPLLLAPDGLTVDARGNLYTVIPMSTPVLAPDGSVLPPLSPVVKIHTRTGEIEPILDVFTFPDTEFFDLPTSLARGSGQLDSKSVYVMSMGAAYYGLEPGSGPKLTQVGIGSPCESGK